MLELELIEIRVVITLDRDTLRVIDREGHGAQGAIGGFQHWVTSRNQDYILPNL